MVKERMMEAMDRVFCRAMGIEMRFDDPDDRLPGEPA
jgi:hypothetical protein